MDSPDLVVLMHDFSGTGVVRNALRIAVAAGRAGLATEVWTVTGEGPLREDLPPDIPGRDLCGGPNPRRSRGLGMVLAVPALAGALRRRKPRILLSAGNHFHLAASAAVLLARPGAGLRFLGRASNALPRGGPAGGLRARLDALKFRAMDRIVAVSEAIALDLAGRGGIPAGRITVIPNGVDLADAAVKAAAPAGHDWFDRPGPAVILGAGRLSRQKNFDLLIEAFALLRDMRPARLVLLGDGPSEIRDRLAALAGRLGVHEDVLFTGFVTNPYSYMAKAGVVAIPSLWEGASNVLVEAMACGTGVVAAATATGVAEVLEEGRFGTVVTEPGPGAFARALGNALDHPRPPDMIRARARDYDLAATMAAYVDLFRRELGDRRRPAREGSE